MRLCWWGRPPYSHSLYRKCVPYSHITAHTYTVGTWNVKHAKSLLLTSLLKVWASPYRIAKSPGQCPARSLMLQTDLPSRSGKCSCTLHVHIHTSKEKGQETTRNTCTLHVHKHTYSVVHAHMHMHCYWPFELQTEGDIPSFTSKSTMQCTWSPDARAAICSMASPLWVALTSAFI